MAINKKAFIDRMAENGNVTKKSCTQYFDLFMDTFLELLREGEDIKLCRIMNAEAKTTPKRIARNPQNGEECIVPEHKRIKIKFSEIALKKLNE